MLSVKYDKLVRDKIPEIIKRKGGKVKFHVADNYKFWRKLKEKLGEELKELAEVTEEFIDTEEGEEKLIEETADFLEVLDAVLKYRGGRKPLSKSQIRRVLSAKRKKAQERGQFKKRIILEES